MLLGLVVLPDLQVHQVHQVQRVQVARVVLPDLQVPQVQLDLAVHPVLNTLGKVPGQLQPLIPSMTVLKTTEVVMYVSRITRLVLIMMNLGLELTGRIIGTYW